MNQFKVCTYNVNFSRRTIGQFEEYHWTSRSAAIYDQMQKINADIWCIQEIHQDNVDEFITTMSDFHWFMEKNNPMPGKITNIGIGIRKNFDRSDIEAASYNFNQYHNGGENFIYCKIKSINTVIVSVHFPMNLDARKATVYNFDKLLEKLDYEHLIITGDFNSFPDLWGYQQIPELNKICGTYSASEFAVNESDGMYARRSFRAYPYDVVPAKCLKMTGKLDHILVKNLSIAENTDVIVHENSYVKSTSITPSDHFPVSAILKW
ncbi:hypothetical protein QLL95_gp0254 [Cotonvirus japonicus]|uniref:Endonuclease/exonuclease/phosphatase domain-containing protein n=1 Tax=Cotonvirus japonicus TaxID=2811091 RepID=A0ABM7NRF2_9VIRU|nr:hypothetical protein QLL95_gp0254 [Cotonvirus japonicus]BCS82743.1 hypothetical protein [Cotonvirus japonicus]